VRFSWWGVKQLDQRRKLNSSGKRASLYLFKCECQHSDVLLSLQLFYLYTLPCILGSQSLKLWGFCRILRKSTQCFCHMTIENTFLLSKTSELGHSISSIQTCAPAMVLWYLYGGWDIEKLWWKQPQLSQPIWRKGPSKRFWCFRRRAMVNIL